MNCNSLKILQFFKIKDLIKKEEISKSSAKLVTQRNNTKKSLK